MLSRTAARLRNVFQFVGDDAHIVPKRRNNGFCNIQGSAGACSRRFGLIDLEKLRVYSNFSPAANWFVEDAEPYELFVNLCFFKRANAVRPYRVDDDFCCFPGTPGTAFPTEFCAFEDNIVYPSIHGHTARSVEKRNAIVPTKRRSFDRLFCWPARRDSIRTPAGVWSLAVTTLHRSVALCRSSFESLRMQFVPIKNDGLRPSFFIGPPEGIRTHDLQNRNLLRYPTAPRTEIFYLRKQIYTKTDKMSRQAGCAYYTPCPDFLLNLFDNFA